MRPRARVERTGVPPMLRRKSTQGTRARKILVLTFWANYVICNLFYLLIEGNAHDKPCTCTHMIVFPWPEKIKGVFYVFLYCSYLPH